MQGGFVIFKDGRAYARVSEILKPLTDFSHIDPEVLANKCRLGTQVHAAIESEIKDEFPILQVDSYGYFKSFLSWQHEVNPQFHQSEQRYYSETHMITGQIDALVAFQLETPYLVDFKTSAQEGKSWSLQAHLYAMLLTQNNVPIQNKYLFIKLDKKGGFPQVFQYKFDLNLQAQCLNLIEEFWINEKK
jgi:hypothetical protein